MMDNRDNEHVPAHLAPNINLINDPQQIMTIQDVERQEIATVPSYSQQPEIMNPAREIRDHTIMDILSRRRVVRRISVAAGGSVNDNILTIKCPNILYEIDQVKQLLQRFTYFKANTKITLIFTAAPSTSGAFIACFTPHVSDLFLANRNVNMLQTSQWPHQIINVNQTPETSMIIPWISPYSYKQVDSSEGAGGFFLLKLLAPLSDVVDITVYAELVKESIQLQYPNILPGNWPTSSYAHEKLKESFSKINGEAFEHQSALLKAGVPLLANTLGIGGLLSAAKNTLHSFGFSKPMSSDESKALKIMPASHQITEDGKTVAHEMAMTNAKDIEHLPGVMGSDLDEMDFDYILRRPNWLRTFKITTDDPSGKILLTFNVFPFHNIASNTENVYYLTHQAMIASMFQYWFGSIVFDFHLFATPFHSLKLRFTYVPGTYKNYSAWNSSTFDDAMSTVVHFGVNSTHQVVCEAAKNLMACVNPFLQSETTPDNQTTMGTIIVSIETPLLVTNTVAAKEVYLTTFMHMRDAVFTVPADLPIALAEGEYPTSYIDDGFELQAGVFKFNTTSDLPNSTNVQQSGIVVDENNQAAFDRDKFAGSYHPERLTNVRQLIRQFTAPVNLSFATREQSLIIHPSGFPKAGEILQDDKIDVVRSMFACWRGGFHLRLNLIKDEVNNNYNPQLIANLVPPLVPYRYHSYTLSNIDGNSNNGARAIPIFLDFEKSAIVHIPYYARTPFITDVLPSDSSTSCMALALRTPFTLPSTDNIVAVSVSRAVDNSYQLGFLCPTLAVSMNSGKRYRAPFTQIGDPA